MKTARLIQVTLVIPEDGQDTAQIADGVHAILQDLEDRGLILDWGCDTAPDEAGAVVIPEDYREGDYSCRGRCPWARGGN